MSILSSIAGSLAGTLAKNILGGSDDSGGGKGGVQIINRVKEESHAEMVARLKKSVESLGGKDWQRYEAEKRRRSLDAQKKPLESAESRADYYRKLFINAKRAASGTPTSSISKPRIKQV